MERISIELTRRCGKACWFCYNGSDPAGATRWTPDEVVALVRDCARNGVRAVSFGGGEPLEYAGLFDVLARLRGLVFRSLTSNGLLLDAETIARLVDVAIDKVHLSIHFPGNTSEVARVIAGVLALRAAGVDAGVNLLVMRSSLPAARAAAAALHEAGIANDRIVYLPMRGTDTPTPHELASVAAAPFQSMTCLSACGPSPRFVSIRWDKTVAWCSYTATRHPLVALDHESLARATHGLGLEYCGGSDEGLVRLSRRAQHGHDMVRDRR
ncbi:MAG TPA: radical SAM protein [Nannocystaceae bacterium]|nr:radical SAM protein [Nannocystaceae bacterium]